MLLPLPTGHICLLWASLLLIVTSADSHSQFDYRKHHAEAAAIVNGHGGKHEDIHEAPRIREKFAKDQQEPERWVQYIPHTSKSIAEEMIEARRVAREEETKKIQTAERKENENNGQQKAQEVGKAKVVEENDQKKKANTKTQTAVQKAAKKAAQNKKAATKKTTRKMHAKAERWMDLVDDDDDDDEIDDDDDHENKYENGRHFKRRKASSGIGGKIWSAMRWSLGAFYLSLAWFGHNLLWIPSKYAVQGIQWSANTSWKTTRWTGERALVGPALTAGAPVIYLGQGFLFLFVWTPARIISFIARELYPIYIFFGAALAVGTAMGIASALVLYIGSFFLSDSSSMEERVTQRAEKLPDELQKRLKVKTKSTGKKSIIEKAIQDTLKRAQRSSRGNPQAAEESDEDDDYFGPNDTNATSMKGKGRSASDDPSPTISTTRKSPTHFGPPLPVGASGWHQSKNSDSNTSTPATSPSTVRHLASNGASPAAYTSGRSKFNASPLTSPDVFRSRSSRQRRGVQSSL